jgi:hypothetical protein
MIVIGVDFHPEFHVVFWPPFSITPIAGKLPFPGAAVSSDNSLAVHQCE